MFMCTQLVQTHSVLYITRWIDVWSVIVLQLMYNLTNDEGSARRVSKCKLLLIPACQKIAFSNSKLNCQEIEIILELPDSLTLENDPNVFCSLPFQPLLTHWVTVTRTHFFRKKTRFLDQLGQIDPVCREAAQIQGIRVVDGGIKCCQIL